MKFGGKPTTSEKVAIVQKRYGATTGASQGSKPMPMAKIKPTVRKGAIGVKLTQKF